MIKNKRTNKITIYLDDYEIEKLQRDADTENLALAVLVRRILESNNWVLRTGKDSSGKIDWGIEYFKKEPIERIFH